MVAELLNIAKRPPLAPKNKPAKSTPVKGKPQSRVSPSSRPVVKARGSSPTKPNVEAEEGFEPSRQFSGERPGYVFKTGQSGTGYYPDQLQQAARELESVSGGSGEQDVLPLDPDDVFDSLPQALQAAFDARDLARMDAALAALAPAERTYHMDRCVKSGLWDPGAGRDDSDDKKKQEAEETETGGRAPHENGKSMAGSPTGNITAEHVVSEDGTASGSNAVQAPPVTTGSNAVQAPPVTTGQLFERASSLPRQHSPRQPKSPAVTAVASALAAGGAAVGAAVGGAPPTPPQRRSRSKRDVSPVEDLPGKGTGKQHRARNESGGTQEETALTEQLEAITATLRGEQHARLTAEARAEQLSSEVERLLKRLSEAEQARDQLASELEMEQRITIDGAGVGPKAVVAGEDAKDGVHKLPVQAAVATEQQFEEAETELDPDAVLATLPDELKAAFRALDEEALHAALARLSTGEAEVHMRRCIAAGLWQE